MIKSIILALILSSPVFAAPRQVEVRNPRGEQLRASLTDGVTAVGATREGELRVAGISQVLFEEHFDELNSVIWDQTTEGTGTLEITSSSVKMTGGSVAGNMTSIVLTEGYHHIFSRTNSFRSGIIFPDINEASTTFRWGMRSNGDGWFFQFDQGVLSACTEFNNAETCTNIDSFNPGDSNIHRYDTVYRNYRVIFIVDFVEVHTSSASALPLFRDEILAPFYEAETAVGPGGGVMLVEGMGIFDDSATGVNIFGFDGHFLRTVAVTASGRLLVSQEPLENPSGTTKVSEIASSDVSGSSDTVFVIPAGSTMTVTRLNVGAGGNISGSEVELFIDELGDGTDLSIIEDLFVNGSSAEGNLNEDVVGDGARSIRTRRTNHSGGAVKIFARMDGYTTP